MINVVTTFITPPDLPHWVKRLSGSTHLYATWNTDGTWAHEGNGLWHVREGGQMALGL